MKRKSIAFILLSIIISLMINTRVFADNTPSFKNIIFFGDSLSDNGNFYAHSGHLMPKSPPYYQGRFSNGLNWADLVSNILFSKYSITSDNFAVGGATASLHNPFEGYLPVTLSMEKDDYDLQYAFKDKSNTLYVIWIGANDYLPGNNDVDGVTTTITNAISDVVQSLISNEGAEFFIISLPDLSLTPQAAENHLTDNYKALVMMHNQKLHNLIVTLRTAYPNTKIMEFNFSDHPILNEIVESQAYRNQINKEYNVNITNVTDACWGGGYVAPNPSDIENKLANANIKSHSISSQNLNNLSKEIANSPSLTEVYRVGQLAAKEVQPCSTPDQYLFWDQVHPSAPTHKVLAMLFLNEIMQNQSD